MLGKFQKAFTLIEVMAAVAVFAISAAGLYSINQQTIYVADHLERKTFAHWVAMNHFNKLSVDEQLPSDGTTTDKDKMAGIEWKITTKVTTTPVQTVKRVVIAVSDDNGQQFDQINGFLGEQSASAFKGNP